MNRQEIVDSLTSDGDEWWSEDESVGYRLTITQDQETNINDFDCYGKVQWPSRRNDYGRAQRPEGFDGAAMKLDTRQGPIWWQPYRDGHTVYNSPEDRRVVLDLLEMGFSVVTLERVERCCHTYDHGGIHAVDGTSLGGIDSLDNGYLAEVVREQLSELGLTD